MFGLLPLIGQGVLAFIVLLLALKYPPMVLSVYLLFASADSYGIGIGITPGYINVILPLLLLVAGTVSFIGLWENYNRYLDIPSRRILYIAKLLVISTGWIGLSVYANDGGMRQVLITMATKGPYPVIIALAYWDNKRARQLILTVVSVQVFIASAIILWPNGPFDAVKASQYNDYAAEIYFVMLSTFQELRVSCQFLNTVQLAFYAGVGMMAAVYLWIKPTTNKNKMLAITISILSILLNYQSMTRGVLLSIIIAIPLVAISKRSYRVSILLLFICLFAVFYSSTIFETIIDITGHREFIISRISHLDLGARTTAIKEFISNFIRHPLFGIGEITYDINMPHILFLDYMLLYGFIPGITLFIMMYIATVGICRALIFQMDGLSGKKFELFSNINDKDKQIAIMLGILAILVAITNGSAGRTLQYVCFGFTCILWVYSKPYNNKLRASSQPNSGSSLGELPDIVANR